LNPSSPIVKIGAVAAGYFLGDKINAQVDKLTAGKIDSKLIGAGQVGLGALLLLSKRPSIVKSAVGGIAAGSGLKRLIGAMSGAATTPATTTTPAAGVNGYGRVPTLGGYRDVPSLGGYHTPGTLGAYAIPSGRGMSDRVMGSAGGGGLLSSN
jgi:hypothetical protein